MKPSVSFLIAFLFFELLSIATINVSFCNGSTYVDCIEIPEFFTSDESESRNEKEAECEAYKRSRLGIPLCLI